MKMFNVLCGLLLSAVVSLPIYVQAATETKESSIEQLVSELAEKPEHHKALAQYYKEKSDEAKKELDQHQAMKKAYFGSSKMPGTVNAMQSHCEQLIKSDELAIKAYNAMAAEHEKAAK